MDWMGLVKLLVPIAIQFAEPKLAPLGGIITHGIEDAENIGGSGPDKLAHVLDLANTTAVGINTAAGKQIVDPALVNVAGSQIISAAVDAANLFQGQAK